MPLTLNETLSLLGMSKRRGAGSGPYRFDISDKAGRVVLRNADAHEVWEWLRANALIPAN